MDRCIDAADRGDGLENALWQLSQEVGTILHHEAPSDFAATLSEPDVAAMDDLHNLMAMLGALMSATAVCTSGERATLFASWLVRVLAEVIRATRQAVLRLPKPRIASNASQSSSYVESFPLNAHAIRHQLQV
ncbi:MAG TPA: hypothetical protein VG755_15830 [Nannocystaceae bacterium]|nr:hypothetical protein [Nannocystaceae bacterium]